MNAFGASILITLMALVLFAPRRWALLGMMAGVLYLPLAQYIIVAGFYLYPTRFLVLVAFIRVVSRGEFSLSRMNGVDRALVWLYTFTTVVFLLRSSEGQVGQIGGAVESMLCYFAFRGLVGGIEEFKWLLRSLVILLLPFVFLTVVERLTGQNGFAFLGGVEKAVFVREGRPRCFASFQHPSLLGTVGAVLLPLYIGLVFAEEKRVRAMLAIVLCLLIVWASNSGGPLLAVFSAVVGWLFWKVRAKMRKIRWAILGSLVLLNMVMRAPVWYLMARLSSLTGGDGWHRSHLIDMAVRYVAQWWLMGMPISDTVDWFPYAERSTGGADITNLFVSFGLNFGVGAIVLFIVLLTRAFSVLGRALSQVRAGSRKSEELEFLMWGVGVMLVVHVVNWFGITYFDQTNVLWFMQLAALVSLSEECLKAPPIEEPHPDRLHEPGGEEETALPTGALYRVPLRYGERISD
jgi:hypothetical protein